MNIKETSTNARTFINTHDTRLFRKRKKLKTNNLKKILHSLNLKNGGKYF